MRGFDLFFFFKFGMVWTVFGKFFLPRWRVQIRPWSLRNVNLAYVPYIFNLPVGNCWLSLHDSSTFLLPRSTFTPSNGAPGLLHPSYPSSILHPFFIHPSSIRESLISPKRQCHMQLFPCLSVSAFARHTKPSDGYQSTQKCFKL